MCVLLASICVLMLIVGFVFSCAAKYKRSHYYHKDNDKWYKFGATVDAFELDSWFLYVGGIVLSLTLVVALFLGIAVSNKMIIDDKIAMYEEENAAINQEINMIVSNYQKHELDVFDGVTDDISPVVVFSMYPELKSNTLVVKQIDTYVSNQKEIKMLKAKKLNYKVCKWWLCF